MENLFNLFAAYAAIWIILFAYILRLHKRQRILQQEVELVRQELEAPAETGGRARD